jgi:hypothetical protein
MVKDTAQAKQEGLSQLKFIFQTGHFHKHDPKGLVLKHAQQVSYYWPYAHDRFEDEIFIKNAQEWEEVMVRMADPKEIRFKAMSWDEQEIVLEQTVQETIKTREEMILVKVVGSPQGTTETTWIS